jgi:hypothetical protein
MLYPGMSMDILSWRVAESAVHTLLLIHWWLSLSPETSPPPSWPSFSISLPSLLDPFPFLSAAGSATPSGFGHFTVWRGTIVRHFLKNTTSDQIWPPSFIVSQFHEKFVRMSISHLSCMDLLVDIWCYYALLLSSSSSHADEHVVLLTTVILIRDKKHKEEKIID